MSRTLPASWEECLTALNIGVLNSLSLKSWLPMLAFPSGTASLIHITPPRSLLIFLTLQENFGTNLQGLRLVYAGDGRNNMANSLMIGSAKLGLHFVICSPSTLFPERELYAECQAMAAKTGGSISLIEDPNEAVVGAHAIYTDVWASMGEEAQQAEREALLRPYQVNAQLMKATKRNDTISSIAYRLTKRRK